MPSNSSFLPALAQSILHNPKLATASPKLQAMVQQWAADPYHPPQGMSQQLLAEGVVSREQVNWLQTLAPAIGVATFGVGSMLGGSADGAGTASVDLSGVALPPAVTESASAYPFLAAGAAPTVAAAGTGANTTAGAGTGPTYGGVAKVLGTAAPILTQYAEGRAKGKQAEANQTLSQDQIRARIWEAQTQNLLQRSELLKQQQEMQMQAPNLRASQAVGGDLLANVQDVHIPDIGRAHIAHVSGGIRPSALGPNARAAGQQLSQIGLDNMGKDTFEVPQLPNPMQLSPLPQANALDHILSVAGPVSSLAGAYARGGQAAPNRPVPTSSPLGYDPHSIFGGQGEIPQDPNALDPWLEYLRSQGGY